MSLDDCKTDSNKTLHILHYLFTFVQYESISWQVYEHVLHIHFIRKYCTLNKSHLFEPDNIVKYPIIALPDI